MEFFWWSYLSNKFPGLSLFFKAPLFCVRNFRKISPLLLNTGGGHQMSQLGAVATDLFTVRLCLLSITLEAKSSHCCYRKPRHVNNKEVIAFCDYNLKWIQTIMFNYFSIYQKSSFQTTMRWAERGGNSVRAGET